MCTKALWAWFQGEQKAPSRASAERVHVFPRPQPGMLPPPHLATFMKLLKSSLLRFSRSMSADCGAREARAAAGNSEAVDDSERQRQAVGI